MEIVKYPLVAGDFAFDIGGGCHIVPTGDFAGRVPRFRSFLTLAMALALLATGLAVVSPAQADEHESEEWEQVKGVIDLICLNPQSAGAVNDVNDTAPADLGHCEGEEFFFGEDLKPVEDEAAALVGLIGTVSNDPTNATGQICDYLKEQDQEAVHDAVCPLPGGPEALPPQLNCGGWDDWESWLGQMLTDANCNGWGNGEELLAGCDPLDPTTHPGNPGACFLPPDDPDEVESWLVGHLPAWANCGGYGNLESVLGQLLADASCNGWGNFEELQEGCNPLNPTSPAFTPCAQVPDPDDPDPDDPVQWANDTVDDSLQWADDTLVWVQFEAFWALGSLMSSLPVWLTGIAQPLLALILALVEDLPDPEP